MKKVFLVVLVVVALMLAGCGSDNYVPQTTGQTEVAPEVAPTKPVIFSAVGNEMAAIQVRSGAEGATSYMLCVYWATDEGNYSVLLPSKEVPIIIGIKTGIKYTIVLWAINEYGKTCSSDYILHLQ